jgi:drug/metabolite transporter (DMT)-like permease
MTLGIFLLVLTAAICHSMWNFAARTVMGNLVVIWSALVAGCILLLPGVIGIAYHQGSGVLIPASAVPYIIATGVIHAVYFALLARAYEHGEISVVYPIARGSGIGLTALFAWFLLQETISPPGLTGICLVTAGIVSMGMSTRGSGDDERGYSIAVCVGISIAAYSLVDKVGVSKVSPVFYIWLMFFIAALVLWPLLVRRHRGSVIVIARNNIRNILIIGGGSIGTYLMILFALQMAPVSYIVAAREFAVVIGAVLGVVFLKEKISVLKGVAIVFIVLGLVCIKAG